MSSVGQGGRRGGGMVGSTSTSGRTQGRWVCRDGTVLRALASESPNKGTGFITKNPIVRLLVFFGVVKGIQNEREYLKSRSVFLLKKATAKIKKKKVEAICIPLVAAFVGWLTNWLAVQMIFYPIDFLGINAKRFVTGSIYGCDVMQPHGLLGWQGIVPAKAAKMGFAMVSMVTTKLVDVQETFMKLDPNKLATLLSIEVPDLARDVGRSLFPRWSVSFAENHVIPKLTSDLKYAILEFQHNYLAGFVRCMQGNLEKILDMNEFVTQYYVKHKPLLNQFFLECGNKELAFLVNSGVWFGFLLGLPQIIVWALVDNIWSLVIGGTIVGYATNWLALKLIFEPVLPVKVGPLTIQGIFLQRQAEVSTAFADFYCKYLLKSKLIWNYLFTGPKKESFKELLTEYNVERIHEVAGQMGIRADLLDDGVVRSLGTTGAKKVLEELPKHVHVLHDHIDQTLDLQPMLEEGLKSLTPHEFENVLHPVFQEEEFILIIAGAVLGALAGALQHVASDVLRKGKARTKQWKQ
ncbi:hypothetical protein HOP50_06g45210 [Chloropicon primus]|nr:hypothetical protein HOP50_06g45210 [Chloropicon primus]